MFQQRAFGAPSYRKGKKLVHALLAWGLIISGFAQSGEADAEAELIEPPLEAAPLREGPPVGFVTHPHGGVTASRIDRLSDFPATAELSNVFGWKMMGEEKPKTVAEIDVDFSVAADWLREVYRSGRLALPILDTGIHHSEDPWRAALTDSVGENLVGIDGIERGWSSFHSPVYQRSVFAYVDQIIDWVKRNDHAHRVPAYINGAEWFWPWGTMDYSDLALAAFRESLKKKYGSVAALNEAWGSEFSSWEEADSVRPYVAGEWRIGKRTFNLGQWDRFSWSSPSVDVLPGHTYEASVVVEANDIPEGLIDMTFVWLDEKGEAIAPWDAEAFSLDRHSLDGGTIAGVAIAPEGAVALRLALKVWGKGSARFLDPQIRDFNNGQSLLPPEGERGETEEDWVFEGTREANETFGRTDGHVVLTMEVPAPQAPYGNSGVAHEDWIRFSFESMAEWLNRCAQHIKERDPSRPVVSYIGWIFGMHSMWDGVQDEQRFDISLANTPDIDINGFQLAIAGDDYTYATFNIDLARKYGKEMWGTDLVDFPYGLFSGFNPIYRASLACVQRGLEGFFYYNWHGTYDYSYSEHMTDGEITRMLTSVKSGVDALDGYELKTGVAQLLPILAYSLDDPGGYKGDMIDAGGLYHLLLDVGVTPDIWTPYEVEKLGGERLEDYHTIFLSDCPVLPREVNDALVAFVEAGGTLIGTGRSPVRDMKGDSLSQRLLPAGSSSDASVRSTKLGSGQVFWQTAKVGRDYWGKVRRIRVRGNTPALFVEQPDPARTPEARRAIRRQVVRLLEAGGNREPVQVDVDSGTIHAATWKNEAEESWKVFLVNRSGGRAYDPVLTFDPALFETKVEVWRDMERRSELQIGADGKLKLPSFAHSAIVTLRGK